MYKDVFGLCGRGVDLSCDGSVVMGKEVLGGLIK